MSPKQKRVFWALGRRMRSSATLPSRGNTATLAAVSSLLRDTYLPRCSRSLQLLPVHLNVAVFVVATRVVPASTLLAAVRKFVWNDRFGGRLQR